MLDLQEFAEANWDESAEDQEDLQQWQVTGRANFFVKSDA